MMRTALLFFCLAAPAVFACDASTRGDGVCDCGCGTVDPDCGAGFGACVRNHCPAGQVPWEHQPETCMSSACGDGWRDERTNEACDDGDALPRGGCSADCKQVNPGFSCGERAAGCTRTGDAGLPQAPDAGNGMAPDAGPAMDSPMPRGGCTSAPAWLTAGALVVWAGRRRALKR
ncbi:MAG: hypothetical protein MUC96_31655 [Myxococcaceae bacterium]|jgi:cysteine-rich repeat protein|nr:hypothetical protein [Myxococcaceae bacterium]